MLLYVEGGFFLYSFFYDKYIHLAVDLFAIGLDDYLRCFDLWRFFYDERLVNRSTNPIKIEFFFKKKILY